MSLLLLAAAALPLLAQQISIQLDPAKTTINFTLGTVLHTVHGNFQLQRAVIGFDAATGNMSGEIDVDAASGQSGNQSRDRRMHKAILESGKYPEIRFFPTHLRGVIVRQGESHVELDGQFEIHGAKHHLTIPADVQMSGDDVKATAHFAIPYVAWGMKNPSTFILRVNDKVEIEVEAVGRLASNAGENLPDLRPAQLR
ncbi:MAG TPA: YceI family protein [Bryobacteraceae bacterium]|nr:YceI family protein [Bryobacteraceae bacterium]